MPEDTSALTKPPAGTPAKDLIVETNGIKHTVEPLEVVQQALPAEYVEPSPFDSLPEKTKAEMRAGAQAIGQRFEEGAIRKRMLDDGAGVFRAKSMELYKKNFGKATSSIVDVDAFYDHDKGTWMTRVTVMPAGADAKPIVVQEPYNQFPSDEMKTWVGITVI